MPIQVVLRSASDVPATDDWLSERERHVLSRLVVPKRRGDWRLGRWTAKAAVARHLGVLEPDVPPAGYAVIEVMAAPDGAPEAFVSGSPAPVALSLSHAAGLAACAVAASGTAIGCDVEVVEPRSLAFVREFFTPEEQAAVLRPDEDERALATTLAWSAKESALKATRTGLRDDTRAVAVEATAAADPAGWGRLTAQHTPSGRRFVGWWRPIGGHVLTVVVEALDSVEAAPHAPMDPPVLFD